MEISMIFKSKDGTAQGVAKQRFIESLATPDKRIINDPYACEFVFGSAVVKMMGHKFCVWLSQKILPGWHEHLVARTRFIDELVEEALINEAEQYVILGAGYDTRAHRLNFPDPFRVFEVDQPEVQERKRKKLPSVLLNNDRIAYVPVDFSYQSISKQLIKSGFDNSKTTIFTLEGVSQYVSKEDLSSLVQEIDSLTQNTEATFYMSYIDELFTTNPEECCGAGFHKPGEKFELIRGLSAKSGEPWVSFYTDTEIERILTINGFSIEENAALADLNSRYFSPVGRTIPESRLFNLERFVVAKKAVTNTTV